MSIKILTEENITPEQRETIGTIKKEMEPMAKQVAQKLFEHFKRTDQIVGFDKPIILK